MERVRAQIPDQKVYFKVPFCPRLCDRGVKSLNSLWLTFLIFKMEIINSHSGIVRYEPDRRGWGCCGAADSILHPAPWVQRTQGCCRCVGGSCSLDLIPGLGTSTCRACGHKIEKKKMELIKNTYFLSLFWVFGEKRQDAQNTVGHILNINMC